MLVDDTDLAKKKICLFPRATQSTSVPNRGIYQRLIIASLALHVSSMTRSALAKVIAKKLGITWKNAYNHIMNELNSCLIPSGIVIENGNIPSIRGPRIYQMTGIPCYSLSDIGILVACSLEELDIEVRKSLLQQLLNNNRQRTKVGGRSFIDARQREELVAHLQSYPQFTLELVKSGVIKFLEGKIHHPLDIIPKSNIK
ncbi:MAG: hypothetical protein QXX64_04740 [Nitrososphaera sp.]